jgi:hypothetical protein
VSGLSAIRQRRVGDSVNLERHELVLYAREKGFPDSDHYVVPVDAVVERDDQRRTLLGNPQVPVPVLLGSDGKEAMTLWDGQDLRPAFIDPHNPIVGT